MNSKEILNFEPKIGFAKEEDVDGVLMVQESVLLENKNLNENPGKSGFLATKIDKSTVEQAIEDGGNEIFLFVAKDVGAKVVGYFLAYDFKKWTELHPSWVEETGIDPKIIKNHKIIYGKHVASNRTIRGAGRKLDNHLFNFAKEHGYDLYIGEICEGPIKNDKSINLHTSEFGIRKVSEYKDGEYTFGVYVKDL